MNHLIEQVAKFILEYLNDNGLQFVNIDIFKGNGMIEVSTPEMGDTREMAEDLLNFMEENDLLR